MARHEGREEARSEVVKGFRVIVRVEVVEHADPHTSASGMTILHDVPGVTLDGVVRSTAELLELREELGRLVGEEVRRCARTFRRNKAKRKEAQAEAAKAPDAKARAKAALSKMNMPYHDGR